MYTMYCMRCNEYLGGISNCSACEEEDRLAEEKSKTNPDLKDEKSKVYFTFEKGEIIEEDIEMPQKSTSQGYQSNQRETSSYGGGENPSKSFSVLNNNKPKITIKRKIEKGE